MHDKEGEKLKAFVSVKNHTPLHYQKLADSQWEEIMAESEPASKENGWHEGGFRGFKDGDTGV